MCDTRIGCRTTCTALMVWTGLWWSAVPPPVRADGHLAYRLPPSLAGHFAYRLPSPVQASLAGHFVQPCNLIPSRTLSSWVLFEASKVPVTHGHRPGCVFWLIVRGKYLFSFLAMLSWLFGWSIVLFFDYPRDYGCPATSKPCYLHPNIDQVAFLRVATCLECFLIFGGVVVAIWGLFSF